MHIALTDRESDLMSVLWDQGPSTVAEVREKLADQLAYTTVLTVLRLLESKGYVGHEEQGRAHIYTALVARDAARRSALYKLSKKFFKGSTELLLVHLVEDRQLTHAQVRRIQALLDRRTKKDRQ